ncbi:hypothetical protein ACH5RR_017732 [Cinchona calisaya]|uniref:F-box domain-containing protein n=1 Tax=Cinchona calisaya TaxID=153742 RepID=A0ABD2ZJS3_9GENT
MLKFCRIINRAAVALTNTTTKRLNLDLPDDEILQEMNTKMLKLDLPDEILQDIFSRLPAKYVLRCASVCRRWERLIMSDNDFALSHYQKQSCSSSRRGPSPPPTTILVEIRKYHIWSQLIVDLKDLADTKKRLYSFDAPPPPVGETIKVRDKKVVKLCPEAEYRHPEADEEEDESTALFMSFSSCGLVVFYHHNLYDKPFSSYFIILNPITGHKLKVKLAPNNNNNSIRGLIYGIFFHPVLNELCLLLGQVPHKPQSPPGNDPRRLRLRYALEFKLLNLGPSPSRWRNIPTRLEEKHNQPRLNSYGVVPPVVLDDVLYWINGSYEDIYSERDYLTWPNACQETISAFDIKSQEFHFLPHPGPVCQDSEHATFKHRALKLIGRHNNGNYGGLLSLLEDSAREGVFNIWSFNNNVNIADISSSNQWDLWTKRYTFKYFCNLRAEFFEPIALLEDGGLLLMNWWGKGLLVHDMKLGTTQLLETKGDDGVTVEASMCAHTHTFFSPNGA